MKKLVVNPEELNRGLDFVKAAILKGDGHITSTSVSLTKIGKYLMLATKSRFMMAKYAIELEEDSDADDFNVVVSHGAFYRYIAAAIEDISGNFHLGQHPDELLVTGMGEYRFENHDLEIDSSIPKSYPQLGTIPFLQLKNLFKYAKLFSTKDDSTIGGSMVALVYNSKDKVLSTSLYNRQVSTIAKLRGIHLEKDINIYLRADFMKELVFDEDETISLFLNEDATELILRSGSGVILMATMNETDITSESVAEAFELERPHFVSINRKGLEKIYNRMKTYETATLLLAIKDDLANIRTRVLRGLAGKETIECNHKGVLNLEVSIPTLKVLLKEGKEETIVLRIDANGLTGMVTDKSADNSIDFNVVMSTHGDQIEEDE